MTATVITTGSLPRLLQEGVRDVFGDELNQHDPVYSRIFQVLESNKAFEVNVQMEGFGRASTKDQGDDITFDSRQQGFTPKYVNSTVAKGFIVTQEALEDELYGQLDQGAQALARSMNITRELDAHSVLNSGFDSNVSMTDGDGSALFSTSHSNGPSGGTFSNKLAVDADLDEASLEDAIAIVQTIEDARGLPAALMCKSLVVASGINSFNAQRIVQSELQNDTGNNAINAVRSMNIFSEGWMHSPYLTDSDAWFIITDAPNGLKFYQRVNIEFDRDNAFTSGNARFKARQRYSYGWDDPRGAIGSQGA